MSAGNGDVATSLRRLDRLLREIEEGPETPARTQAREIVRLVLALHSDALARITAVVDAAESAGRPLLEALARDPLVGSVLLLHDLHPMDLATRVHQALDAAVPALRDRGARVARVAVADADVHVTLAREPGKAGAPAAAIRAWLEDVLVAAAPDVTTLRIEGPPEPAAWVPLEHVRLRPRAGPTRP